MSILSREEVSILQLISKTSVKHVQHDIQPTAAVFIRSFPTETQKSMILHQRAVVSLQDDVQNEDELRRVSLCFSLASLTRAHVIAVHWVAMDTNYDGHDL
jgi:hypothetical protein